MGRLTKPVVREIIDDFAKEIEDRKTEGPKPATTVINFRDELRRGYERKIYYVPHELLLYRKDNGRISSDILDYEKDHGYIDEKTDDAQKIIRSFLEGRDKLKTEELKSTFVHEGQRDPAIITSDGFLINGNRRKMVLDNLSQTPKYQGDPRFQTMKVVILPGKDDVEEGGPPTLLEIEQIENRYQLQSDGKAEYYKFDRALSMRRKIQIGMSIEAQLRDDPVYSGLSDTDFKKNVKKFKEDYIEPLKCIDRYLTHIRREGLYSIVSTGLGDPEGRWQAFYDYYNYVYKPLSNDKKRSSWCIREDEIGKIEDVAFKIIRQRDLKGLPKSHQIIRLLPKLLRHKESKKELFKLNNIDHDLATKDCLDKHGNELDPRDIDKKWAAKNQTDIIRQVKKAQQLFDYRKDRETTLNLLEDALKKLNHEDMDTTAPMSKDEMKRASEFTKSIQERAHELERELYYQIKNYDEKKQNLSKKYKTR